MPLNWRIYKGRTQKPEHYIDYIITLKKYLCYGVCGRMVKALDPRARGLEFDFHSSGHVQNPLGKLWIHITSSHPAVMGTWCTDPRLDRQLQPGRRVKSNEFCTNIWTPFHLYLLFLHPINKLLPCWILQAFRTEAINIVETHCGSPLTPTN